MSPEKKRFNLPTNYYVNVHPLITVSMVSILWVIFPILAFSPNALDFAINDKFGDFIEENRYNLVKLFNAQLWVSWQFSSLKDNVSIIAF